LVSGFLHVDPAFRVDIVLLVLLHILFLNSHAPGPAGMQVKHIARPRTHGAIGIDMSFTFAANAEDCGCTANISSPTSAQAGLATVGLWFQFGHFGYCSLEGESMSNPFKSLRGSPGIGECLTSLGHSESAMQENCYFGCMSVRIWDWM